mmetsp:Transcript_67238/g.161143  ORF Transcript_67238/g.161143 Transcript_67238/m.161143 type:complete len:461 (-) Transcript_67238:423-1805(-)
MVAGIDSVTVCCLTPLGQQELHLVLVEHSDMGIPVHSARFTVTTARTLRAIEHKVRRSLGVEDLVVSRAIHALPCRDLIRCLQSAVLARWATRSCNHRLGILAAGACEVEAKLTMISINCEGLVPALVHLSALRVRIESDGGNRGNSGWRRDGLHCPVISHSFKRLSGCLLPLIFFEEKVLIWNLSTKTLCNQARSVISSIAIEVPTLAIHPVGAPNKRAHCDRQVYVLRKSVDNQLHARGQVEIECLRFLLGIPRQFPMRAIVRFYEILHCEHPRLLQDGLLPLIKRTRPLHLAVGWLNAQDVSLQERAANRHVGQKRMFLVMCERVVHLSISPLDLHKVTLHQPEITGLKIITAVPFDLIHVQKRNVGLVKHSDVRVTIYGASGAAAWAALHVPHNHEGVGGATEHSARNAESHRHLRLLDHLLGDTAVIARRKQDLVVDLTPTCEIPLHAAIISLRG